MRVKCLAQEHIPKNMSAIYNTRYMYERYFSKGTIFYREYMYLYVVSSKPLPLMSTSLFRFSVANILLIAETKRLNLGR